MQCHIARLFLYTHILSPRMLNLIISWQSKLLQPSGVGTFMSISLQCCIASVVLFFLHHLIRKQWTFFLSSEHPMNNNEVTLGALF